METLKRMSMTNGAQWQVDAIGWDPTDALSDRYEAALRHSDGWVTGWTDAEFGDAYRPSGVYSPRAYAQGWRDYLALVEYEAQAHRQKLCHSRTG
jgi:hypothetical protein